MPPTPALCQRTALACAALLAALARPARADPALTLDGALELAAAKNADLLSARADADAGRADVQSARAAVLPRLDLQSTFGRDYWGAGPVTVIDGFSFPQPAGNSAAYGFNLQATQTIFDLSRQRTLEEARHASRAGERQVDEAALLVSFQVTERFYNLVKEERILSVLGQTAARSEELVGRADALFAAGRTPKSETYSARVNLSSDRIAVEAEELRVAQARSALAQVLGWADPQGLQVVAPPELDQARTEAEEPPPLEALLARARERRPALAVEEARVAAARAGVGLARSGEYPTLLLQATYSRSGMRLGGRDGVYGDPSRAYNATGQLVLSWNLFQGFGTAAQVTKAEAGLKKAEALAQASSETVAVEVENARSAVVSLSRQERLARENLQVARDALRLATERFNAGLATQLEERDASLKLAQAELTLVESRIDHTVARADLVRAVGGTL
ncbi:MAG TPA: TolC family protein [Anaeromyxobacter sp.]|nr:TolC family protein [Anaeromyxobacter sp.]